jgi:hypothetical protein
MMFSPNAVEALAALSILDGQSLRAWGIASQRVWQQRVPPIQLIFEICQIGCRSRGQLLGLYAANHAYFMRFRISDT